MKQKQDNNYVTVDTKISHLVNKNFVKCLHLYNHYSAVLLHPPPEGCNFLNYICTCTVPEFTYYVRASKLYF